MTHEHCQTPEEDDPITLVGRLICPTCGAYAWPREATWLDPTDLVFVVYAPGCGHLDEWAMVVDPVQLPVVPRRCAGRRRDGQPCRGHVVDETPWCRWHGGRKAER